MVMVSKRDVVGWMARGMESGREGEVEHSGSKYKDGVSSSRELSLMR